MRALITGITGFAGSFLAEHLLAAGDDVLGTSRSGRWPDYVSDEVRRRVPLVAWDLTQPGNEAACEEAVRRFAPQGVYHLAAVSVPAVCGKRQPTARAQAVNVYGAARVAELANVQPTAPRMLFVSSSHVYAPVSALAPRVAEDAPREPRGGYGLTKLAAEDWLRFLVEHHGQDIVVARAFQHAGPRQNPRLMLSEWARQLAVGGPGPVQVHSLHTQLDLSDVRDVVRAYRLLVLHGRRGGTYNVGSGVSRSSGQVFELLSRLAGNRRPVVEIQPGVKQDWIADTGRLRDATGWRPEISLEQTVADTYDYWMRRAAC